MSDTYTLDEITAKFQGARKPGNGCWIARPVGNARAWEDDARFTVEHVAPSPAPVYKSWRQRAKADRKRHFANHKRWLVETREPKAACQDRMAKAYALWLCERDSVDIPNWTEVRFEHDWLTDAQLPGAKWHERKRYSAVVFGRMVDNDPPAGLNSRERRKWQNHNPSRVFAALLTVAIPNWDHVPQVTENSVDAREALTPRPFALPMMAEGIAA